MASLLDELGQRDGSLGELLASLGGEFRVEQVEDPGAYLDRAGELQKKWGTELGQVWLAGSHRLMCGDSTSEADVGRLMAGETARLMVTDPPYGVNYEVAGDNPQYKRGPAGIQNDNLGSEQAAFWTESFRHWPLDGDAYVFSPSGPLISTLCDSIEAAGIVHHQWLIWVKQQLVLGRGHFHYRHEHIFYGWKGRSSWNGSRTEDSVWEADRPLDSPEHPTMKPVELCARAIGDSSKRGDIVAEPFLGSGSTLVACEQLGRHGYGMEVEPKYVAVTLERLGGMGLDPQQLET